MPLLLLILFIVLPVLELYLIIQVGQEIGVVPTLAILIIDGLIGAALSRSQGRAAWARFNEATAAGRIPAKEVFDGVCIIVGGAFLLAPGFITDFIGLSLLIPPSRALYRRILMRGARVVGPLRTPLFFYDRRPGAGRPRPQAGPSATPPPPSPRPPRSDYDIDGSAREIPDTQPEIERGSSG